MRLTKLIATAALLTVSAATLSSAQTVVYDNGAPNGNGYEIGLWIEADDFMLSAPASFDQIRFWSIEELGGTAYSGEIQWWIFADEAAMPGSVLHSGTGTPTRTNVGLWGGCCERYQNDMSISSLSLGAGSYWLGLHNGTSYGFTAMYWETSISSAGSFSMRSEGGTMDNWETNFIDLSFQLLNNGGTTVPEPASIVLLATGLIAVFGATLRRRKSTSA